jgi:hypothetical protein
MNEDDRELQNGGEVTGYYFGASTEFDPSKRELFLRAPLFFRADDEKPALAMGTACPRSGRWP